MKKHIEKHTRRLDGKTVAISGATGGIGRELCAQLARLGASLVLLDRNYSKSSALKDELQKDYPSLSVRLITVELEDIESVKQAAEKLTEIKINHLILNAGAYSISRRKCSTGFDNVFQINFVSPYYLARRLLPDIRARGGSVVAVGSIAHDYSKADMSDIDFSSRTRASLAYGNAKRFLTFSLLRGFADGGGISVAHPGISFTGITAHYPKFIFAIIKNPMKIIFMKPKKACLSVLYALFDDCGRNEWIGPRVFGIWGLPKKQKLSTASDAEADEICAAADKIYSEL
ncbi:MAG: SDR family NAD(P)-dependent oxidoreductase [Clostridia bacterium]|nr:SDR family NAD(P)-dependent oxidoreductase [Clostridia bacterium]